MARAPFQILVFPYRQTAEGILYAIFARADYPCWQGIAGGGEDDEAPLEAAMRESWEEAGIPSQCPFLRLETVNSIPVYHFSDSSLWGEGRYIIPEYTFGVAVGELELSVAQEHKACRWATYEEATSLLMYAGNKIALWELNQKLLGKGPRE
jgi:dATP pyrophosphohydrolase